MRSDVVGDVSCRGAAILGEVPGVERGRRWSEEETLGILLEVDVGGAAVTQVAQRHEITRSQIYGWRRDLKKKGPWSPDRGAVFLPADFAACPEPASSDAPSRPVLVELRLNNGRCPGFDSGIDGEALTRLIRAVDAAHPGSHGVIPVPATTRVWLAAGVTDMTGWTPPLA